MHFFLWVKEERGSQSVHIFTLPRALISIRQIKCRVLIELTKLWACVQYVPHCPDVLAAITYVKSPLGGMPLKKYINSGT
jgi:hypothetical protein